MAWNKWDTQMFKEYCFERFGDDIQVLGEYVNNTTDILMYHKGCGRSYEQKPVNVKGGKGCPLCNGKFLKTNDQFIKEVKDLVGSEYTPITKYVRARDNIRMRHNECGHVYKVTPDDFLNGGNRCPNCAPNKPKNTEAFKEEVSSLYGEEYEVIGEYVNNRTPVLIEHTVCGRRFNQTPKAILLGHTCYECNLKGRSGENHYRYNPNLTDEERQQRDMFNGEIRKWRETIYRRDKYTCAKCGVVGHRLNAHHINSWDEYESERFDIENGITLCESCHSNFHSRYGYGNNNEEQFNDFIATLF